MASRSSVAGARPAQCRARQAPDAMLALPHVIFMHCVQHLRARDVLALSCASRGWAASVHGDGDALLLQLVRARLEGGGASASSRADADTDARGVRRSCSAALHTLCTAALETAAILSPPGGGRGPHGDGDAAAAGCGCDTSASASAIAAARRDLVCDTLLIDALMQAQQQQGRIAAGRTHSALIDIDAEGDGNGGDGGLYCCGIGGMGQLCNGMSANQPLPQWTCLPVEDGAVAQVSCGAVHTLLLSGEGRAFRSSLSRVGGGMDRPGQGPVPTAVLGQRSSSRRCLHPIVFDARPGLASAPPFAPAPVRVSASPRHANRVAQVAAAAVHSALVTASGALFTWGAAGPWLGWNEEALATRRRGGSRGGGVASGAMPQRVFLRNRRTHQPQQEPQQQPQLEPVVVQVTVGAEHTVAVTADGGAYSCGTGRHGKLGSGYVRDQARMQPVRFVANAGRSSAAAPSSSVLVLQAAAGASHTLFLCAFDATSSEQVGAAAKCAGKCGSESGDGGNCKCKNGCQSRGNRRRKARAAAADASRCATHILSVGAGSSGQLGLGGWSSRKTPQRIPCLAWTRGSHVVQVAAGDFHSLAVTVDGRAFAWGMGMSGQLGQGSSLGASVSKPFANQQKPVEVFGLRRGTVRQVAGGQAHSLFLCATGDDGGGGAERTGSTSVWSCGAGWGGRLGRAEAAGRHHATAAPMDGLPPLGKW